MNKFGNLVASTFMFIFGLASLWVAIKALLKGSISMASGSEDVLFSTNPIGFLFVVTFWIVFGLFLIWVSSRKEVDPFQPDDSSDANGKRADYLPEPLLLYKSHAWAIGIIVLMTLFMLPLGYFSLALSQSLGAGFGLLYVALVSLVFNNDLALHKRHSMARSGLKNRPCRNHNLYRERAPDSVARSCWHTFNRL